MNRDQAAQLKRDYEITFGSTEGKRVLLDILAFCHVVEPSNTTDPNVILIKEGRRDAALTILQKLTWDEKDFLNTVGGEQ